MFSYPADRPVTMTELRSFGLTTEQAEKARLAAELLAQATGLSIEEADRAVVSAIGDFSPKPQRFSPRLPQKW